MYTNWAEQSHKTLDLKNLCSKLWVEQMVCPLKKKNAIRKCQKFYILFYLSLWINLNKSQRWKKPSRSPESDYGEENKTFSEFIFTAFKLQTKISFDPGGLFPTP